MSEGISSGNYLTIYVTPYYKQGILLLDGNKILAYLSTNKRLDSRLYKDPRQVLEQLLLSLPYSSEDRVAEAIKRVNPEVELETIKGIAYADIPLLEKESSIKTYLRALVQGVKRI